ncbi:MAG: PadR family transcriptional regulator [Oscillospiraceae bacterium]
MSLSNALLGFLGYAPMTGYELKKIFNDSVNFFWLAQTSQIYRELKTLENEGCIVSEVVPGDRGPDKRKYSITPIGAERLYRWLKDAHKDEFMRNEFMVWILFSSKLGTEELQLQLQIKLRDYRREYEMLMLVKEHILDYAKLYGDENDALRWSIVLSRGIHDVRAKVSWAEEMLEEIERKLQN